MEARNIISYLEEVSRWTAERTSSVLVMVSVVTVMVVPADHFPASLPDHTVSSALTSTAVRGTSRVFKTLDRG